MNLPAIPLDVPTPFSYNGRTWYVHKQRVAVKEEYLTDEGKLSTRTVQKEVQTGFTTMEALQKHLSQ